MLKKAIRGLRKVGVESCPSTHALHCMLLERLVRFVAKGYEDKSVGKADAGR